MEDYKLTSVDNLTLSLNNKGITSWTTLLQFVKNIPYGRNENRTNFSLVISENKGTCSSKHAYLKQIALLNNIDNVQLILGMYKMNAINTPKIGDTLLKNNLSYLPEAHCYLKISGKRVDVTTAQSDIENIVDHILIEKEIQPNQVIDFKVAYHQKFLKKWIKENKIPFTFHEIWKIREQCIINLST